MEVPSGWGQTLKACWVFPAVIAWKLGLMVGGGLPPPANDAFFYDGPVVHYLRHGAYVNPSLERGLPISATEVFSAYPPFYQAVLTVWMGILGPTVTAGLLLHGILFAVYAGLVLAVLRRLAVPAAACNVAGAFLAVITFHDRPDSIAHVLGFAAIYGWLRSWVSPGRTWAWQAAAVLAVTLGVASALQTGAMYAVVIGLMGLVAAGRRVGAWPWRAWLGLAAGPIAIALVTFSLWPRARDGFVEHLGVTPAVSRLHWPAAADTAKILRTVPAVLAAALIVPLAWRRLRPRLGTAEELPRLAVLGATLAAALCVVVVAATALSPNYIFLAAYLQPLVVGLVVGGAGIAATTSAGRWLRRGALALAAVGAVRAVGLTTWGVVCAWDISRADAEARVRQVAAALPAGVRIVASSPYLYELAGQSRVTCIHADWPGELAGEPTLTRSGRRQEALRPACFILTPYDYFRRYQATLAELAARGQVTVTAVEPAYRIAPPDAYPALRRVLQHVSWAPVVVRVEWTP